MDFARGRLGGGSGVQMRDADDLGESLQSAVNELRAAHPRRQSLSEIHVDDAIRCDSRRLQQAASNLIANALTLRLAAKPIRGCRGRPGKYLYARGAQARRDHSCREHRADFRGILAAVDLKRPRRLGLGPHICAQIARTHRGSIAVSSTHAEGTRFSVSLPQGH
jgi:signal transduction histidine kinase